MQKLDSTKETLEYYNAHASDFAGRTAELNMSDIHTRFLSRLLPGSRILDFGCGSGRDSASFLASGFDVDALDGSAELCKAASERYGIHVRNVLFEDFSSHAEYDGIWACASVLHLPKHQLKSVLQALAEALKPGGILYISFKYGEFEGLRNGRFFTDLTPETFRELRAEAVPELLTIEEWITEDVRPGREEQWLNIILRRI